MNQNLNEADQAQLEAVVAEYRARLLLDPDGLFVPFADALNRLAGKVGEAGRHQEALDLATEAVAHTKKLMEKDPNQFALPLSSALNTLSNRLSDLGRDDEAREVGDEGIKLAGAMVELFPAEARFLMVSGLMNQSGRSWRAGQSLRAIEEMALAVETFRDGGEPLYSFLGVMVDALHRNAIALSEGGLWSEAVAVRRLTIKMFPDGKVPAALYHLLAVTLHQAAFAASRDGHPGEALPMVEEAAEIARDLAEANPEDKQVRLLLAQSLANLASRQHEADAQAEALEAVVEAVNLFHECAKDDPAEVVIPLSATLQTFAAILVSLGHHDQAKTVLAQRESMMSTIRQVQE